MKIYKKLLAFVLTLVLCTGFFGCSKKNNAPENRTINYNISYEPDTLDPQIADDEPSRLIILNIFEGLVRLDKNDNISPGAAESWDVSDDLLTYTFRLRDGLKWSDGSSLTAEDFRYGILRSLSPQTGSSTSGKLFSIKNAEDYHSGKVSDKETGITIKDKRTLEIILDHPDSELLYTLTTPPAMPCSRSFFEASGGQYGRTDEKILCNGAFTLEKNNWVENKYIYLSKNSNYNGKNKPVPAGVNLTIGKDFNDLCEAINNGETDCGIINTDKVAKANEYSMHLESFPDKLWGISFNTGNDILKNLKIRSSLLSCLDKSYIMKDIPENCDQTNTIIPEFTKIDGKSFREIAGDITFDPVKDTDKTLKQGLSELDVLVMPNLTILCPENQQDQAFVNDLIETWNKLTGTYFNKKPVSENELKSRIQSGSFQIAICPIDVSENDPVSIVAGFSSDSKYNPSALESDEFDSIINDIRKNDGSEAVALLKNAESFIFENAVFYPLYTEYKYCASAKNITGIIFRQSGTEIDFFNATKKEE